MPLSPTPIDFVEQNPFVVIIHPVASNSLVHLTSVFEQFVKQILVLVTTLVITAAASARSFPFAFATSTNSFWFWF